MLVYRLGKEVHIRDLQANGGLFGSGRWHDQGTRVLYTAESFSLAKLEVLANTEVLPKNYAVVVIEIPEDVSIKELQEEDLPANWTDTPAPAELKKIALDWISENEHMVMKVPSVHSPYERNYLINPLHPDHGRLKIVEVKTHIFDKRLKPEEVTDSAPNQKGSKPKPKQKPTQPDEEPQVVTFQEALRDPQNKAGGGKMRIRFPKGK